MRANGWIRFMKGVGGGYDADGCPVRCDGEWTEWERCFVQTVSYDMRCMDSTGAFVQVGMQILLPYSSVCCSGSMECEVRWSGGAVRKRVVSVMPYAEMGRWVVSV